MVQGLYARAPEVAPAHFPLLLLLVVLLLYFLFSFLSFAEAVVEGYQHAYIFGCAHRPAAGPLLACACGDGMLRLWRLAAPEVSWRKRKEGRCSNALLA